jgi:hypothetical protein
VEISRANRERIFKLIGEAETLDLLDLIAFYRWANDSYEALKFHPLKQQRFNEYCRLSCDTHSMRVYVGTWLLRLAVDGVNGVGKITKTG